MHKAFLVVLLFAAGLTEVAAEPASTKTDVNFYTRLRMNYARRKDFNPAWKIESEHLAAVAAYQAKNYKRALKLSEQWLAKCPVDADMHGISASAARMLGDQQKYKRHVSAMDGFVQSILHSGGGLTPKTAYKIISVDEEYFLVQRLGGEILEQSLIDGTLDRLECKFADGATKQLYFDASIPINVMKAQMGR